MWGEGRKERERALVHLLQAVRFPVVATFSGEAFKLLTSALHAKTTPILMVRPSSTVIPSTQITLCYFIQYLGYLDLYLLSIHSSQRRKKVYSLNQSGQPEVWNVIHAETLSLISSMTTRLSSKKQQNGITGIGPAATTDSDMFTSSSPLSDHNQSELSVCPFFTSNSLFVCFFPYPSWTPPFT